MQLTSKLLFFLILHGLGGLVGFGLSGCSLQPSPPPQIEDINKNVRPLEAVSALGRLAPAGDVRRLAPPVSGFGGTPRISKLLVREGDVVKLGQVIAIFDSQPQILADLKGIQARINTLKVEIKMQKKEVSRYRQAAVEGAAAFVLLEEKEDELVKIKGQLNEALAEKIGLNADFADSELKSPIDGIILRVHSRVGERPGNEGVVEVGANKSMEALIEVYESDVNRVKLGQEVSLVSENGGFDGTLFGKVYRISPQVRQRNVLSTDPTGDVDARIVEVLVILQPESAKLVTQLTGLKVIARFIPML